MSLPVLSPSPDSDDDFEQILMKPKPRQTFELSSPPPSEPPTPSGLAPVHSSSHLAAMDGNATPSRTKSLLNLTSSTLFGIYQGTGYNPEREENATPWGTGAQTPAYSRNSPIELSRVDRVLSNGSATYSTASKRRISQRPIRRPRKGFKMYYLPLIGKIIALFAIGVLYAVLITQLHESQAIAPTKVDINRSSWTYLMWWGLAGVVLGEALPWVDTFWASEIDDAAEDMKESRERRAPRGLDGWMDVVRSIGAFAGVAFAIRRLPWQSTLQLSLTLALANPAIWYIVDRSPPGFVMSTGFAIVGTIVLLGMNPALMPSPSPAEVLRAHVMRNGGLKTRIATSLGDEDMLLGIFTEDSVGVATWIASVLFVSSVCFGNIGRRLALSS